MHELALFAGAGGGLLAGHLLGWTPVCAVERDAYAACVLANRQNDRIFPPFPIWSDVETFDGREWRGIVDVVSGGFPCQDISGAGKGAGLSGPRSGLWFQMLRIIREVQPEWVFIENSDKLIGRGICTVESGLSEAGFTCRIGLLSAAACGANHERQRCWIVGRRIAHADVPQGWPVDQPRGRVEGTECLFQGEESAGQSGAVAQVAHADGHECQREWLHAGPWGEGEGAPFTVRADAAADIDGIGTRRENKGREEGCGCPECFSRSVPNAPHDVRHGHEGPERSGAHSAQRAEAAERRGAAFRRWPSEPGVVRVVHGLAHGMDRIKALGNGQVPRVAAAAFTLLARELNLEFGI